MDTEEVEVDEEVTSVDESVVAEDAWFSSVTLLAMHEP